MADSDQLTGSLQESIISALAFSDDKRSSILTSLSPDLFEPPYDEISSRLIEYRLKYNEAPGKPHIDDVFDYVLSSSKDRRKITYERLINSMMQQADDGLNIEYITSRVREFVRRQSLKGAILEAAELYQQTASKDNVADEVEAILMGSLNKHIEDYDPGTFMSDAKKALSFLESDEGDYLRMGIPALDRRRICPVRKELLVFIGSRGSGKSWFCVHLAKMAEIQHWKVLYISLEMSEPRLMQRLFQSFFGVAKRQDPYVRTLLDIGDNKGKLLDLRFVDYTPKRTLIQSDIGKYFREKIEEHAALKNIIVKQFPTKSLTVTKLRSYLDQLEALHSFTPDLLIIDYPDLMNYDTRKDSHIHLGRVFEEIRGLAVERNMAIVAPTQSTRAGEKSKTIKGDEVAGDISKIATADNVITFTRTLDEKQFGLARLFAAKGRNDEDKFSILITQDYATGQFCLSSVQLEDKKYWKLLEEKVEHDVDEDDDE